MNIRGKLFDEDIRHQKIDEAKLRNINYLITECHGSFKDKPNWRYRFQCKKCGHIAYAYTRDGLQIEDLKHPSINTIIPISHCWVAKRTI